MPAPECMRITDAPDFAINRADSAEGSALQAAVPSSFALPAPLRAVTSFQISAPQAKAALNTSSLVVSTEIGIDETFLTAWIIGITLEISSSMFTGV